MESYYSEMRVAQYDGDISELIKRYSTEFFQIPIGIIEKKYTLIKHENNDSILITISQGPGVPEYNYNVIISVFSKFEKNAIETMRNITDKLQIETRPIPEQVKRLMKNTLERHIKSIYN